MLSQKAYVVITSQPFLQPAVSSPNILILQTLPGKSGQYKFVTQILPESLDFIRHHLDLGEDVAVVCDDGKDISVGVAVAALSLFFDDEGVCVAKTQSTGTRTSTTGIMIQMTHRYPFFQLLKTQPRNVCNGSWPRTLKLIQAGQPSKG
jgi:Rit1 DUSP-like domain